MIIQLVECLPNMHKALGSMPVLHIKLGMVTHGSNLGTWEVEAGGQKLKVILSYTESLSLAKNIGDPV